MRAYCGKDVRTKKYESKERPGLILGGNLKPLWQRISFPKYIRMATDVWPYAKADFYKFGVLDFGAIQDGRMDSKIFTQHARERLEMKEGYLSDSYKKPIRNIYYHLATYWMQKFVDDAVEIAGSAENAYKIRVRDEIDLAERAERDFADREAVRKGEKKIAKVKSLPQQALVKKVKDAYAKLGKKLPAGMTYEHMAKVIDFNLRHEKNEDRYEAMEVEDEPFRFRSRESVERNTDVRRKRKYEAPTFDSTEERKFSRPDGSYRPSRKRSRENDMLDNRNRLKGFSRQDPDVWTLGKRMRDADDEMQGNDDYKTAKGNTDGFLSPNEIHLLHALSLPPDQVALPDPDGPIDVISGQGAYYGDIVPLDVDHLASGEFYAGPAGRAFGPVMPAAIRRRRDRMRAMYAREGREIPLKRNIMYRLPEDISRSLIQDYL